MKIYLNEESMTLKDFVFSDKINSIINVVNKNCNAITNMYSINKLLAIKIFDKNETTNIYIQNLYYSNSDEFSISEVNSFDYVLSINKKHKYIIYKKHWIMDMPVELGEIKDYRVKLDTELSSEMELRYKAKFQELLIESLPSLKETADYQSAYLKACENEDNYRCIIREEYLIDKIERKEHFPMSLYKFKENDADLFHKYLTIKDAIEKLAVENFKDDFRIENVANLEYYNKLSDEIILNPDEVMIKSREVRKCIKNAGKTLNLKLKNGEIQKVNNVFYSGEYFFTVVGHNDIYVKDIDEIIFRKNVLYKDN